MTNLATRARSILEMVQKVDFVGPLLARLVVGLTFVGTGWGKLHGLDKVTEFFVTLHIPAPHFQAVLVACTEFFGGLALVLGLGTRLAALPLAVTMIVALKIAKLPDADGFFDAIGFEETTYLAVFVWLAVAGAGRASIDHVLRRALLPTARRTAV